MNHKYLQDALPFLKEVDKEKQRQFESYFRNAPLWIMDLLQSLIDAGIHILRRLCDLELHDDPRVPLDLRDHDDVGPSVSHLPFRPDDVPLAHTDQKGHDHHLVRILGRLVAEIQIAGGREELL